MRPGQKLAATAERERKRLLNHQLKEPTFIKKKHKEESQLWQKLSRT